MSWGRLDGHDVAFLQLQAVHVVVIAFAGILELHLYEVCNLIVSGHVGQPVIGIQLVVLASASLAAQASVAAGAYLVIQVIIVHVLSIELFS